MAHAWCARQVVGSEPQVNDAEQRQGSMVDGSMRLDGSMSQQAQGCVCTMAGTAELMERFKVEHG